MRFFLPLAGLCLTASAYAAAPVAPSPLPANYQQALAAVKEDPPPPELAANAHFFISDERGHWVFEPAVRNLGGVVLGVGTDPNYTMSGWMRPDLVLIVDFDEVVIDVHRLYKIAFLHAANSDALVHLWSGKGEAEFVKFINADTPQAPMRAQLMRTYRMARGQIHDKLLWIRSTYKKQNVATFMTDAAQYDHIVQLLKNNRIWAWRGDLTANNTMAGIATALKAVNRKLQVFYITNAEKYFTYVQGRTRKNFAELPYEDNGVILRTQGHPEKADDTVDGMYFYFTQKSSDFVAWLTEAKVPRVWQITWKRQPTKVNGLFTLPGPPPKVVKVKGKSK